MQIEKTIYISYFQEERNDIIRSIKKTDETCKNKYEALELEYEIISSLIDARKVCNITQKQLSENTGIAQSDISKIENGSENPTLKILQWLANGLGMNLNLKVSM